MFPTDDLQKLALAWAEKHPHLLTRLLRAVWLVGGVKGQCEGVYVVRGSKGAEYIVVVDHDKGTSLCTCKDHQRGNHCKHRLATALHFVMDTKPCRP